MMGLTPRQFELLGFLRTHVERHGIAPTVDEIRVGLGFKSKAIIADRLRSLEERGLIRRPNKGRYRGVQLVQSQNNDLSDCNCEGCARAVAKLAALSREPVAQHLPSQVA